MNKENIIMIVLSIVMFSCTNDKEMSYYENGQLKSEGFLENRMKQGRWVYFMENGDTLQILNYSKDNLDGKSFFYENNTLKFTETYKNGIRNGENIFYYENGQVESIGTIKNNLQEGKWMTYYRNGKLRGTFLMKKGKPIREFVNYYQNGNIQSTGEYISDTTKAIYYDSLNNLIWRMNFKGGVAIDTLEFHPEYITE